jgi:hypothetical protein
MAVAARRKYRAAAAAYWFLSVYNIIASAFMAAYPTALAGEQVLLATLLGATVPISLTILATFKIPTLYTSFGEAADEMEELIWALDSLDWGVFMQEFDKIADARRRTVANVINNE